MESWTWSNKWWSFWNNWIIIFHSIYFPISNMSMLPKVFRVMRGFFCMELQYRKWKTFCHYWCCKWCLGVKMFNHCFLWVFWGDLSCPAPPLLINMWFEVLGHLQGVFWELEWKGILILLCSTFAHLQGNRDSWFITYCKQKGKFFNFEMDVWLRCLVPGDQQRGHSTECIKKTQGSPSC